MTRVLTRPLLAVLLFCVPGCGGSWTGAPAPELEGTGVASIAGATVVTAEELHTHGGTVLRAILGKVPNLKVEFVGVGRCPSIALRRAKDFRGYNYPSVYLDGTHAQNTCILESLQAGDLDRVEIYPQGFTTRPGYATSTHGLILLFSRQL